MNYRREIDGLRAVAVVPVILFHAGFSFFSGGFVGVDVFFVISGYLITSIILAEMEAGKFSIVTFYERRARRILPALFFVMAVSIPLSWLWLSPDDMKRFSASFVGVSVFSSNFLFWIQSGYFDAAAELKPMLHTWSLAVEEQFYVLFPLFLMLTWSLGRKAIVVLLFALSIISLSLAQWSVAHGHESSAFFLLPTRAWELAMGSLAAFYLGKSGPGRFPAPVNQLGSALGLVLVAYAIFAFDESTPFPSLYALVPTVGTALVIGFATADTYAGRILGNKLCVAIGLISYSAYLWHQPLFAFARHASLGQPTVPVLVGLSFASLGLAYVSWRYVEQPFRMKQVVSRAQIFLFSAAGTAFFLAFGLAGYFSSGYESVRTNLAQRQLAETALPSPKRKACHTQGLEYLKPANACEYQALPVRWAVFGDSHAVELAYGLSEQLKKYGTGVKHFSFSGCSPAYGMTSSAKDGCAEWTNEVAEYIVGNPAIEYVVVSYRMNAYLFGDHEGKYPSVPDEVPVLERDQRWAAYIRLLEFFNRSNKKVIAVLQAPELPTPISTLIFRNPDQVSIPGSSLKWWNRRSTYVRDHLAQIPRAVVIVDPARLLCENETCYAVKNNAALYFDDDHLSVAGAELVAQAIVSAVGQQPGR